MKTLREIERIEGRVLGALRCVDGVTGVPVERLLDVRADGARILRSGSGLYVLHGVRPLAAHEAAFVAPPALPPVGDVALTLRIADPVGEYLPRRATIDLPRDPDPDPATPASLFRPIDVPLHPSPASPVAVNWSLLRIQVLSDAGEALGGALLRVVRNGSVLARGSSDWRGEALVPVAGVPVTTFSEEEDEVAVSEIEVSLEAIFDPAAGSVVPLADVRAGRAPAHLPAPDPAALESALASLPGASQAVRIAARRAQIVTLAVPLP